MNFFDPKIPKKKIIVEILHTQSAQYLLKCVLFLNASSKYSDATIETLQEFLQNCGQFIPAKQATAEKYSENDENNIISLYNTSSIIYIKEYGTCSPSELKDLFEIHITLNNKSSLKLSLSRNFIDYNTRLADYVNTPTTFLKFIKNKSFIHLNKNFIFSMRTI